MTLPNLSRRKLMIAGAALPFAPALIAAPAQARADLQGGAMSTFNRFQLGEFEVTSLLAGTATVPDPQAIFGLNASPEDFAAASTAAFIPIDRAQFFFTPTLVNTGTELVLFDTGMAPEGIVAALGSAGVTPDQIDIVVLTHMHPDHIGGMAAGGTATFPNARYVTGAIEHNFWSGAANELFDANVRPFNDNMTMLDDGGAVVSGITAVAAYGHTPGHFIYNLESAGQRMAITADTANHYVWSLAKPDWEVQFDADKAAAAATRKAVFGMIAADRIPFLGYHMPFPGVGFVEAEDDGFRYVPASYQFMLDG